MRFNTLYVISSSSLKSLGDAASAMNKPLIQAVEAMADAMTGENERLKEFGIRASMKGDEIAYNWTDSSGKAKHVIIKNNSEIIEDVSKLSSSSSREEIIVRVISRKKSAVVKTPLFFYRIM